LKPAWLPKKHLARKTQSPSNLELLDLRHAAGAAGVGVEVAGEAHPAPPSRSRSHRLPERPSRFTPVRNPSRPSKRLLRRQRTKCGRPLLPKCASREKLPGLQHASPGDLSRH